MSLFPGRQRRADGRTVLLLAPSSGLGGGIERYLSGLEEGIKKVGWSVYRVDLYGRGRALPRLRFVIDSGWVCLLRRPDVTLVMHLDLFRVTRLIAILGCQERIGWVYGGEVFSEEMRRKVARRSRPLSRLMTISEFSAERVRTAVGPARGGTVGIVRPALSDHWFEQVAASKGVRAPCPRLVIVTRLGPELESKGVFVAIDVARKLRETFPTLELHVIGGGDRLEECRERVRGMEIDGWCHLLGRCSDEDLVRELKESWLFLLPTRVDAALGHGEGFGIVFIEAASVGIPVIGSSDGGAAETVLDGVTGFLVDPRDDDTLLERCAEMLRDPGLCECFGAAGARWVQEEFSHSRMVADLRAFLDSLPVRSGGSAGTGQGHLSQRRSRLRGPGRPTSP